MLPAACCKESNQTSSKAAQIDQVDPSRLGRLPAPSAHRAGGSRKGEPQAASHHYFPPFPTSSISPELPRTDSPTLPQIWKIRRKYYERSNHRKWPIPEQRRVCSFMLNLRYQIPPPPGMRNQARLSNIILRALITNRP